MEHNLGSPAAARPSADLLDASLEAALRGDPKALEVLLTLLKTKYGKAVWKTLGPHRKGASTATMDDIFQQSMVDFIEEIRSGKLRELGKDQEQNVLLYFVRLCERKLGNRHKHRKDPVLSPRKSALPFSLIQDRRVDEADPQRPRHEALLQEEIARLEASEREVLELFLSGVSYREISERTGRKISTLENQVSNTKRKLADRLAQISETAELHQAKREHPPVASRPLSPSAREVLDAVATLPVESQEAIRFVHLEGGTVEALSERLGDRGLEKAAQRLKRGYQSLSLRLEVPFPDSFSVLLS